MIVKVTNYHGTQSVKLWYPAGPWLGHKESVIVDFRDLSDREVTDVMQVCWENVCGYVVLDECKTTRIELLLNT